MSEIQNLTNYQDWRFVDSANNPADDVTRGKHLSDFLSPNRWTHGPTFLHGSIDFWPKLSIMEPEEHKEELKRSFFCGNVNIPTNVPNVDIFKTYQELLDVPARSLTAHSTPTAANYQSAENQILKHAQIDSFGEDLTCLCSNKRLPSSSRLLCLAPELCSATGLILVGGRLRHCSELEPGFTHAVVLDHTVTKLIIKHYDAILHHTGSERLYAEIRRKFWILRGREAIRHSLNFLSKMKSKAKYPKNG